jgi:glycosyltransferase involved in cell wall biosynthesis
MRRAERVLFVGPSARTRDGWGRYLVEVARGVRACGLEPVLATADDSADPLPAEMEHHAVLPALFRRRFETPRSLLHAPRLARVLSTCDLVHGIAEPYLPLVAAAKPRGMPFVQTAHGTWGVRSLEAARGAIFRTALRAVDLLICQSRYTHDRMAALTELPPAVIAPGGVRAEDFAAPTTVALPDWSRVGHVALVVGAVKPRKGVHVALDAVARARRGGLDVRLVVAGHYDESSRYVQSLRRTAEELDLTRHFTLLGRVSSDELVAWYHRAAVCLLLAINDGSSFEGLGLVLLEAAAAGTPSIGSAGCGAEDAIADGVTGFLVPQGDAAAAASLLARLLEDRALLDRMGCAARERAQRLSWANLSDLLVLRYLELLARDPRRRRVAH